MGGTPVPSSLITGVAQAVLEFTAIRSARVILSAIGNVYSNT